MRKEVTVIQEVQLKQEVVSKYSVVRKIYKNKYKQAKG